MGNPNVLIMLASEEGDDDPRTYWSKVGKKNIRYQCRNPFFSSAIKRVFAPGNFFSSKSNIIEYVFARKMTL